MTVDAQGWLSWAIKMPGRPATGNGFNPGTNTVKGLVFHSAEGFAGTLLDPQSQWGYYSAEYPWHISNLLDGRLVQHYPFTARCWHGSAFNQDYVGMEHEGLTPAGQQVGPILNAGQIANDKRVIADLAAWKCWTPRRPAQSGDKTATLYEHKETIWFGGTSTGCPNNRIPWDLILATEDYGPMKLNADGSDRIESEGGFVVVYHQNVPVWRWGGDTPGEVSKNFNGSWYSLAHVKQDDDPGPGQQSPAVWSNTLAD